jgi:hypothetical protein
VPAGVSAAVSIYVTNTTDVLLDIDGYFKTPSQQTLQFYPLTPCRVADTRNGKGFSGAFGPPALVAGVSRDFPLQGSCGIPVTAAVYSARMTVVPPGILGFLTTWPAGLTRPTAATLNAPNGGVIGNEAIVPAGTGGAISFYASDNTDLIIDANGYFAPPATGGLTFYPLPPCRIADTRVGKGTLSYGPPVLAANASRDFLLPASFCGVPNTAQAYSLNLTVLPTTTLGFLTAYPTGQTRPTAATLNALSGGVVGGGAIVPAGTNGAVSVFASDATNLIIDINGYFAP